MMAVIAGWAGYMWLSWQPRDVIQFPEPCELPGPRETIYVRATYWRAYRYNPATRSSELVGGRG